MQVKNATERKTPLYCSPIKPGILTPKQRREIFIARAEAARNQAGERYLAFAQRAGQNFAHQLSV
jgi:hypothetical protein